MAACCGLVSTVGASEASDWIEKGAVHDDALRAAEALVCYQEAEKLEPENVDLLVRIARQYRHLMADAEGDAEKLRLGEIALKYGERAALLGPNDSDAQLSVAISYGKMVKLLGSRDQVKASSIIRSASERAATLDPENDLAWHILGRWHCTLADTSGLKLAVAGMLFGKLPPASIEDALDCLQKASALAPGRVMHEYELGRAYQVKGDLGEAKKHFQKACQLTCHDKGDEQVQADAKQAIEAL